MKTNARTSNAATPRTITGSRASKAPRRAPGRALRAAPPGTTGNNDAKPPRYAPGTLATALTNSSNEKTGKVAVTYAAQDSCPTSCRFFDGGGCYAEQGTVGMFVTKPLNAAAKASSTPPTPERIAQAEADAIDDLRVVPGQPLRLHIVGDCRTDEAASTVAAAAARYEARGGGRVWSYTHAWRFVGRESWGDVNVLASCETAEDVLAAQKRGYATSIVVEEFATDRRYDEDGVAVIPCPAQTKSKVNCASCQLCLNSGRLRQEKLSIGFAVHGTALGVKKAVLALRDPDNPDRKLTSRERIPRFVDEFVSTEGRQPTVREIAEGLDLTSSSVYAMRKELLKAAAKTGPRTAANGRTI